MSCGWFFPAMWSALLLIQKAVCSIAEDINQIAFKTLRDRMVRELSNSLLRVAVKQGIKQAASKQNEWLGFAVGIANALTEKADTRNWQTLPYMISYTRVPLGEGASSLGLRFSGEHAVPLSRQVNGEFAFCPSGQDPFPHLYDYVVSTVAGQAEIPVQHQKRNELFRHSSLFLSFGCNFRKPASRTGQGQYRMNSYSCLTFTYGLVKGSLRDKPNQTLFKP